MAESGKILVVAGLVIAAAGLVLWLGGNKFSWLGNLPGDIRIERENVKVYIPITTMLLVSAGLTLALWVFRRFF